MDHKKDMSLNLCLIKSFYIALHSDCKLTIKIKCVFLWRCSSSGSTNRGAGNAGPCSIC